MENERNEKSREIAETVETLRQKLNEIEAYEKCLCDNKKEKAKKETNSAVGSAAGMLGTCACAGAVFAPPSLAAGGAIILLASSGYVATQRHEISDLKRTVREAKAAKTTAEMRKIDLEHCIADLRNDIVEIGNIGECLHRVFGLMLKTNSTVIKMKYFWPGLFDFCDHMMQSEQRLISVLDTTSTQPVCLSEAFKRQVVEFLARSVCLHEVCFSCLEEVQTAHSNLRQYRETF